MCDWDKPRFQVDDEITYIEFDPDKDGSLILKERIKRVPWAGCIAWSVIDRSDAPDTKPFGMIAEHEIKYAYDPFDSWVKKIRKEAGIIETK